MGLRLIGGVAGAGSGSEVLGGVVDAGSTAGTARPVTELPVLWLVDAGVTPENAEPQDLIAERADAGADSAALHESVEAGFAGWSFDPAVGQSQTAPGTQSMSFARVKARESRTVTDLYCYVGTLGSGLTYARMAIYGMDGTLLGTTTDQTTAFGSTGQKACTLAASVDVDAGTEYLVGVLQVGTTPAALLRGQSGSPGAGNVGFTSAPGRFLKIDSQATVPASVTPGSMSGSSISWWVGMR